MAGLLFCGFATVITSCVDNDDNVPENYYSSTKLTAAQFLEERPEQFSEFIALLKRTPYFSMLSTYGTYSSAGLLKYTVFAPTNDGVDNYLKRMGYASIYDIPAATCDTLVRTHIIKKGAFFTTDVSEGALPELNMDDSYIVLSSDSDVNNNNKIIYYINKNSRIIERDDSVTNGVVHVLDNTISSSSLMLPDKIAEDSILTLFSQALKMTGMCDSLMKNMDETYYCGEDSVNTGTMERCTSGSQQYTRTFWVGKRYFKYTAFVEPDSVFHRHGIYTIEDLQKYAKKVYDETYPEDAGLYDNDPHHRKNPLNRFVSYHLMDRMGNYSDWAPSGRFLTECTVTSLADAEDFWETMCPNTMLRFCRAGTGSNAGLYANRKGVGNKYTVKGVKVLTASESGKSEQQAINGTYLYLDDILEYSTKVRDEVLSCRMRIDATTLSADFMNQGCRFNDEAGALNDRLYAIKRGYIKGWKISDDTFVAVHPAELSWSSYLGNAICIKGQYDVQFKLPPVPSGTYEIRMGYVAGEERGVVQVYLNNEPCGIPVDLTYGTWNLQDIVGDIADTEDEEHNTSMDKTLHNLGYMRGMDSYRKPGLNSFRQDSPEHLRRILATQKLDEGKEYWLRFRQVSKGDKEWSFDYIELCPKDVYASPEGENRH